METASAVTAFSIKFLKLAKLASQKVNLPNNLRLKFNRLFSMSLKEIHALNEQVLNESIIGGFAKVGIAAVKGTGKIAWGATKLVGTGIAKVGGPILKSFSTKLGEFAAKIFIVLAAMAAIIYYTKSAVLSLATTLKTSSASWFDSLFKTDSGKVILDSIETSQKKTDSIILQMSDNANKSKEYIEKLIAEAKKPSIETTPESVGVLQTSARFAIDAYDSAILKLGGWYDLAVKNTSMGYDDIVKSLKSLDYTTAALYIAITAGSIIAITLFAKWLYLRIKRVAISRALTTDNISELPATSAKFHSDTQKEDGEIRKTAIKEIKRLKNKVSAV